MAAFDRWEFRRSRITEGVKAWIDPEGYRRWVSGKKRAFEDEVDSEMGVAAKPAE
jgi:metallo-beta-lactamase class B